MPHNYRRRRHAQKEFIPRATKLLFEKNNAWEKALWNNAHTFSLWQITCIEREFKRNDFRLLYEITQETEDLVVIDMLLLLRQKQSIQNQLIEHCLFYK